MMRGFLVVMMAQCGAAEGRPAGQAWGPGPEPAASTGDSTGDRPRLDLGVDPPLPDLPGMSDETGSTGGQDGTGDASTGPGSTGTTGDTGSTGSTSTGPAEPGSTGDASTSTSTGDPPAPVCGDGTCDPGERVTCYVVGPGWCKPDCYKAPECITDCPCAGIVDGLCDLSPGTCDAVKPGGLCDPNGDGSYMDADFTAAWLAWQAKCK